MSGMGVGIYRYAWWVWYRQRDGFNSVHREDIYRQLSSKLNHRHNNNMKKKFKEKEIRNMRYTINSTTDSQKEQRGNSPEITCLPNTDRSHATPIPVIRKPCIPYPRQ